MLSLQGIFSIRNNVNLIIARVTVLPKRCLDLIDDKVVLMIAKTIYTKF